MKIQVNNEYQVSEDPKDVVQVLSIYIEHGMCKLHVLPVYYPLDDYYTDVASTANWIFRGKSQH